MIALRDALNIMDDKDTPFDIKFFSFNKRKEKGGQLIELENCMKCGLNHNQMANHTIGVRPIHNSHHPIPVHIRLIVEVNGEKVFY